MSRIPPAGAIIVFVCPTCKGRGEINADQYHGRVSILCQGRVRKPFGLWPACTYHATKDWSQEPEPVDYVAPGCHFVRPA